ncbi:MAG: ExeM/NucH family extracellular endonuclease [Vibrio gallaecicus]|uniref:ExeM/NucH family extracellular endonuclease n=1 Tax=Vibrio kagoshimensis TaxID=2910244 RepID=UPI0023556D33
MNKKITLLAGAISGVLSGAALADVNDVLITEYVEGSANNKAVEISNTGTTAHTFDGTLSLYYSSYKNQIKDPDGNNVLQGITLEPGKSIVVLNGEAGADIRLYIERLGGEDALVVAGTFDQVSHNAMNFNGDDAVWLGTDSSEANVKDIFATYGHSGDKLWADKTMRRKAGSSQSSTYNESEWEEFGKDAFGGLGHPTDVNDDPVVVPVEQVCTDATGVESKLIGEVQGEGKFSPLIPSGSYESTDLFKVTGIVSAVTSYPSKGFYLYDENADGKELSSDGIFVPTATASDSMVGQKVCVVAKVKENYGLTQLVAEDDKWEVLEATPVTVTPVEMKRIASDTTFESTLERYEGMLVKTVADMDATEEGNQDMRVSRSFSFDYDAFRNNMVLAYKRPNAQPNQDHIAGSIDSMGQAAENDDFRLILESDGKAPNGQIPYYSDFASDPQNNYVRINDSVVGLTGVIGYSYGDFNITVPKTLESSNNSSVSFVHNTDRTNAPVINESYGDDGFTIKVATQNVLNYFNSPYGGSDNSFGDNRGAESQLEFERQQAKLVSAIYGLDADILGLMEIENNGFGDFSAITELLTAINKKYYDEDYGDRGNQNSIHNRYVFVGFDKNGDVILDDQDTVGSDAITTGIIYRPSKVSVISGTVIPMPEQHAPMIVDENGAAIVDSKGEIRESGDNYQRNTVAATFNVLNTGKQLTVSVNHLKSKGSTCYEDWVGWETWSNFDPVKDDVRNDDYQGSCENFRVAAAYQLGTEMAKIGGDQVVLGDMNSYANEDPMLILTSNPTNKEIYASSYTFLGKQPSAVNGQQVTQTFGFLNAVDLKTEEGKTSWSYSYNDEVGSLDHMLITSSLEDRLVDAVDWHINAPESSLFDYNSKYKGGDENEANPFYAETPFRSSDHDSAIVSLGYKYGEAGESAITIATKSGRADIGFPVSAEAKAGDIAEITISPLPENVALPKVTLSSDGAQTVMFDVAGLDAGSYSINMTLKRAVASQATAASSTIDSMAMSVEVTKRDSSNVKPIYPSSDGSGGSFGFGALLSLIGLGFLRRRRS